MTSFLMGIKTLREALKDSYDQMASFSARLGRDHKNRTLWLVSQLALNSTTRNWDDIRTTDSAKKDLGRILGNLEDAVP